MNRELSERIKEAVQFITESKKNKGAKVISKSDGAIIVFYKHIIKVCCQPWKISKSWCMSINTQQQNLQDFYKKSGNNLRNILIENFEDNFKKALKEAIEEMYEDCDNKEKIEKNIKIKILPYKSYFSNIPDIFLNYNYDKFISDNISIDEYDVYKEFIDYLRKKKG